MFGFGKKQAPQGTQIPYEVYETVQQPEADRRRWIVRLIAALVVVTLLIFGGTALVRFISARRNSAKSAATSQPAGNSKSSGSDDSNLGSGSGLQPTPPQSDQQSQAKTQPQQSGGQPAPSPQPSPQPSPSLSQQPQRNGPLPNTGSEPEISQVDNAVHDGMPKQP